MTPTVRDISPKQRIAGPSRDKCVTPALRDDIIDSQEIKPRTKQPAVREGSKDQTLAQKNNRSGPK